MEILKPPAETLYETELRALREEDKGKRPPTGYYLPHMCEISLLAGTNPPCWMGKPYRLLVNFMGMTS